MKTLILSDLHDDFWAEAGRDPLAPAQDLLEGVEAVVLAGDVSNKAKTRWKPAAARLRARVGDVPIHVIPGNHDFYDGRLRDEDRLVEHARNAGLKWAQCSELVFGATRLLCATLWTDYELGGGLRRNRALLERSLNDFRYIRLGGGAYRPISPADVLQVHRGHRKWIEDALARPHDGPTFVVTHHPPHPDVLAGEDAELSGAYASDLSPILEGPDAPDAWLFGHSHQAKSIRRGRVDLRCIALGFHGRDASDHDLRARIARALFDL